MAILLLYMAATGNTCWACEDAALQLALTIMLAQFLLWLVTQVTAVMSCKQQHQNCSWGQPVPCRSDSFVLPSGVDEYISRSTAVSAQ